MNMLTVLFAACLGLIAASVIVGNWYAVVLWKIRRKHVSWIPLVGGVFGAGAIALLPPPANNFWFVPLVVDLGCVPLALGVLLRRKSGPT